MGSKRNLGDMMHTTVYIASIWAAHIHDCTHTGSLSVVLTPILSASLCSRLRQLKTDSQKSTAKTTEV